jgi:hypothetical protein
MRGQMLASSTIDRNVLKSLQDYVLMNPSEVKGIASPFAAPERRQMADCIANGDGALRELRRLEVRQSFFRGRGKHHASNATLRHTKVCRVNPARFAEMVALSFKFTP